MADQDATEGRPGFLARLGVVETLILAAIALIGLAGLMLIGKGFYMKATAEFSQAPVELRLDAQTAGQLVKSV